ncbi:MAG: CAP domain-containing protein [Litorilinea sp.]
MSFHAGSNPAQPSPDSRLERLAQASIEEVNQARIRMGLPRLQPDPHLSRVAHAHSMDMARRNFYSHVNPDRQGPAERLDAAGYDALMSAENIARGYRDPALVVNGWLDSPGHRANILHTEFRAIGAGYFIDSTLPDGHFWTHLFAVPDRSATRDPRTNPQDLLALLNQERAAAGYATLSAPPSLQTAIMQHTVRLAAQGTAGFSQDTGQSVRVIADTAAYSYRRIIAHFVCGRNAGTPDHAFDQLMEGGLNRDLLTRDYVHAAIGYHYVPTDSHRHYWFVLLASPAQTA